MLGGGQEHHCLRQMLACCNDLANKGEGLCAHHMLLSEVINTEAWHDWLGKLRDSLFGRGAEGDLQCL